MKFSIDQTLARAQELIGDFEKHAKKVSYERKGVLSSEMFFLFTTAAELKPKQILESGRARGQSTHLLCVCFPESKIISIEFDPKSSDVPVAEARLREFTNVCLLFGDSRVMLPQLMQPGDVVLIDGPKSFRAIRLALNLLRTGKPALVFIHDCYKGLPERQFLERYVPGTFFSDDHEFVKRYSYLDQKCKEVMDEALTDGESPYELVETKDKSYGPTLACIPCQPGLSYIPIARKLAVTGFINRMRKSFQKRLSRSQTNS